MTILFFLLVCELTLPRFFSSLSNRFFCVRTLQTVWKCLESFTTAGRLRAPWILRLHGCQGSFPSCCVSDRRYRSRFVHEVRSDQTCTCPGRPTKGCSPISPPPLTLFPRSSFVPPTVWRPGKSQSTSCISRYFSLLSGASSNIRYSISLFN